ncbi:MAG: hypothetical protein H6713_29400 [Myxococcales bacterium]|nr:hypothetical protein [Myxococcales bacterium]
MRARLPAIALLATIGARGASARAATGDEGRPEVVLVVPQRAGELDERAASTVQSHLLEEPCTIALRRPAAGGDPFEEARRYARERDAAIVLWIELEGADERGAGERDAFLLYVLERDAAGLVGRRVEIMPEAPSAAVETLANVAGAVASALLAGDAVALEPAETLRAATADEAREPVANAPAPTAAPARPPAAEPSRRASKPEARAPSPAGREGPRRMGLSLGYSGNIFASGVGWQSAIAAAISWLPAPGARVSLGYDFVFPSAVETPLAAFSLRRHPVSLSGAYRFVIVRGLDVELGARVTVDPIARVTASDQGAPAREARAVYVFSGVAPTVGLGYQLAPELRLGLFVGVEAVLSRTRYSVQLPDRRMIVVDPYPVRALAGLRLDFSFLRARSSAARARE